MNIFAIFKVSSPLQVENAVNAAFPDDHMRLQDDEWLVASSASAQDVSDRLGITSGENGSAIVFRMGSYYGRASTNIWDWIKTKSEESRD
ncbi:MAG: hypothetical protein KJ947_22535 [Alphaproteobacteria bacterium]|jgi:hypothetical protein|nr:hypothetical protein [Alphaproteobacteria bacterium]MBU1552324.1 hypothetical protein [Alphaproteobacteria bacterium]MBU2334517.1 hypothetical protein [Alphaproteobacteria bacterium]MBU2386372.1 hypothetical protein [Alphaproteobacteria bacterium]|tara:strand:- start:968 stop:1237 length:270 start_codon:yes stop_codon:yes gene_type:complete